MALSKSKPSARNPAGATPAHERIDKAAYDLFSRLGVRAVVSVDQVIAQSGVAKATLYRHYPTKEHLALAFMRRREELWTRAWLQHEVERIGGSPGKRLLGVFDIYDRWFRSSNFDGCAFVNVMLETKGGDRVIRPAAIAHLTTIRKFLEHMAGEAGITDPEGFAWKWHILMKGAIIAAGQGDLNAARRAREIGELLLTSERVDIAQGADADMTSSRDMRQTRLAGGEKSAGRRSVKSASGKK